MNELLMHPDDADLLMLLDHELPGAKQRDVQIHVDSCPQCRDIVKLFEAGTASIVDLLHVDLPSPAQPRRRVNAPRLAIIPPPKGASWFTRPYIRAALVIVGLGITVVTVSPLRAWVGELFVSVTNRGNDTGEPTPLDRAVGSQGPVTSSIAFVPTGSTFEVSLATWQAGGTLTIVPGPGVRAQGNVRGAPTGSPLLVAEHGIRITNSTGSRDSYQIQVPASVRVIEVTIAGEPTLTIHRAGLTTAATIPLAR